MENNKEIKVRKCTIQLNLQIKTKTNALEDQKQLYGLSQKNESHNQFVSSLDTDQYITEKALPSLKALTNALVINRIQRRHNSRYQSQKDVQFKAQNQNIGQQQAKKLSPNYLSKILSSPNQLNIFFNNLNFIKYQLLYRASENGFSVSAFHQKCDNFQNTIVVCLSQANKIFGGFTPLKWNQDFKQKKSFFKSDNQNKTFLFSVALFQKYELAKQSKNKAICAFNGMGPTFGGGYDLQILDKTNLVENTCSYFPSSFSKLDGKNPKKEQIFGTRRKCFKLKQYEVFKVIFLNKSDTFRSKQARQLRSNLRRII